MKNLKPGQAYKWRDEEIEDIVYLYTQKKWSMKKISNKYRIKSRGPIKKILEDNDVQIEDRKKYKWSNKEKKDIVYLYKYKNYSLEKIGDKYNTSKKPIIRVLLENNVKIRDNRKYKINHKYFKTINTEDKAYWLGFIAADGGVVKNRLCINLSKKDKNHLSKFVSFLNSDYPVREYKYEDLEFARLSIDGVEFTNYLKNKGIVENKSLILKPPKLETDFIRHFWRGYFDGDGTLYFSKRNNWNFSIVGTLEMLNSFKVIINSFYNSDAKICKTDNIYSLRFSGNILAPFVMHYLYKDCSVYLERKYKKYLQMCKTTNINLTQMQCTLKG